MTRGKKTCKILKEIRQEIANRNDIEYITSECHFKGECKGTCPKCEAELRYLERELQKRQQLGKAVAIAGISLGMAGALAACNAPKQDNSMPAIEQPTENFQLMGEIAAPIECDTIKSTPEFIAIIGGTTPVIKSPVKGKKEIDIVVGEIRVIEDFVGELPVIEDFDVPESSNKIFDYVQEMPQFPGGSTELEKFIQANLQYPEKDLAEGMRGAVVVQFVVETDGSLTDFKVIRSVAPAFDAEALRTAKLMPAWSPGKQNGKNVRVSFRLPIRFKIKNDKP